jgi:murein DD-endopeptidase MepM/ murein hydrolase activator NlpD
MPLEGGLLGHKFNRTLHGRSRYRPANVTHHNVVHGYRTPGVYDAIDVFGRPGEVIAGTPVLAMHSGTVTTVTEVGKAYNQIHRSDCLYITSPEYLSVYCHIHLKDGLGLGSVVQAGDVIGYVDRQLADPHLHLELVVRDGRTRKMAPVTAPTAKAFAEKVHSLCGGRQIHHIDPEPSFRA